MSSIRQWKINLFYIVTMLFWASVYTYQPTMSPYLKLAGVSYSMIGLIGGSYGFTQMLLRIPFGILSDRLGRRKAFVVGGLFAASLSSLLLYMVKDPVLILLARGLAGVAASSWVVFTVLFSSYFVKEKSLNKLPFLAMCNNLGQVIGILAGSIAAGFLSYRFPFALGAMIGAAGLFLSFAVKENVPERLKPPKIRDLLSVAKNKNLMVMSSLAALSQVVMFGTFNTFTPAIAAELGASSAELGYLSMLGNVPRILSALLCGILLARRVKVSRLIAASFVLLVIGSAATPFCSSLWVLYGVSIVTGFGMGITMTGLISLCTRSIDDARRSAAMGFFQAIYGVGMFVGPVVVGVFADLFGMTWGFIFSAGIAALGVAGSLVLIED